MKKNQHGTHIHPGHLCGHVRTDNSNQLPLPDDKQAGGNGIPPEIHRM